jgi:hypothetical protein
MISYWTNFAKTGDPNEEGLPSWPAFTSERQRGLIITETGASAAPAPNLSELSAIDRLYATVRVLLKYGVAIAVAAGLLVLAITWWLLSALLRGRKRAATAS